MGVMKLEREPTSFEQQVYRVVQMIPEGRVSTYGRVARCVGAGSARAVGQALKRNPYAPEVPCHRVVAADLSLGGFFGEREGLEIERKVGLLKSEGVEVSRLGRVSEACLYDFE